MDAAASPPRGFGSRRRHQRRSVRRFTVGGCGRKTTPLCVCVPQFCISLLYSCRFKHNVLVKNDPKIRFYAGAPLVSSVGYRMGSLCIIDRKPRTLDAEACNVLCNFAEIVVRQIEKTTTSLTAQHAMTQQTQRLLRALNCFSEGLMMCQLTGTGWNLLYVNDVWVKITGTTVFIVWCFFTLVIVVRGRLRRCCLCLMAGCLGVSRWSHTRLWVADAKMIAPPTIKALQQLHRHRIRKCNQP